MRIPARMKPPSNCATGCPATLPKNIPQRDVDRRIAAHFRAGGAKPEIANEVLPNALDRERIAAEQFLREASWM